MTRHGLSIGIERSGSEFFLTLKAVGTLTHEDYQVITPMLESALEGVKAPHIKALIDCTELTGWEARAAWDDFKLGIKHRKEFTRIAMYGNQQWQSLMATIGNWFTSGEIKYFDDAQQALAWLGD